MRMPRAAKSTTFFIIILCAIFWFIPSVTYISFADESSDEPSLDELFISDPA